MKVIDIGKRFFKEEYNSDYSRLIEDIQYLDSIGEKLTTTITEKNVVNAFCCSSGDFEKAKSRFKEYMLDNFKTAMFYDLENNHFLTIEDIKKNNF